MPKVAVKIPEVDEKSFKRLSLTAERVVFEELKREEMLELSNELLKESELTKEEELSS